MLTLIIGPEIFSVMLSIEDKVEFGGKVYISICNLQMRDASENMPLRTPQT